MSETQFYVLCAIPLVGILLNSGLFIYLGGRLDALAARLNAVADRVGELSARVAVLEDRHGR